MTRLVKVAEDTKYEICRKEKEMRWQHEKSKCNI